MVLVMGAAIVRAGRVLAARRTLPTGLAGGWEFPGGKVEPGELPEAAVVREIAEELGCRVEVTGHLSKEVPIRDGYTLRVNSLFDGEVVFASDVDPERTTGLAFPDSDCGVLLADELAKVRHPHPHLVEDHLVPGAQKGFSCLVGTDMSGGQVAVPLGAYAVAFGHRCGAHPRQVVYALAGVEHRAGVAHQLEGVPVTGADQDLEALVDGLGGQRGDDVVGLVTLLLDRRDPQRRENLLDQRHLSLELVGGLRPVGLVVGVLRLPEGVSRDVERHADVGRPLVAQDVDQHGGEAVHRIGRLACRGGEVLHR